MSDKVFNLGRIIDWTVGSVVASFFTFAATGFAGYLNGSFARICEFAKTNTFDLVILTVISFSLGSFVCLIMAALVRKRKIKSIEAEHAREIERIRSEYERQLAELRKPDETPEQKHERMLKAACADIKGLSEYGTLMLCDLLGIDDAITVEFNEREAYTGAISSRLLEIKPTRNGKLSIRASALAREAAPLVFADE